MTRILAFSGSLRQESFNQKLVTIAAQAAQKAGAEVTLINLRDYPLPIFDQDLEARGTPENAKKLKELFLSHEALLISSPEYNSSITAVLKNAIDWVSRTYPGESPLAAFKGKVVGLMSASPGALGGLRGLVHLRAILGNIQVLVIPEQLAVSSAADAFDLEGQLKDSRQKQSIESIAAKVVELTRKING